MRMTNREKFMLMLLVLLVVCGGFYQYFYLPTDARIQAGEAELARLIGEHKRLLGWQAELAQTEARIKAVQAELEGWVSDAKAVSDIPLAIRFLEAQAAARGITLSSIRLGSASASLTFRAPSYAATRSLLVELEKMSAFEVLKYRYAVSGAGPAVDGTFDIKLNVGGADETRALPGAGRTNPFVR